MHRPVLRLAKLLFGCVVLWCALRSLELHELRAAARDVRWCLLIPLCGVAFIRMLISSVRWRLFIDYPIGIVTLLRLYFIGVFFNTFLPSSVGGDLYKGVLLVRYGVSSRVHGLATSLLDRLAGIAGLLVVGALACVITPHLARQTGALFLIGGGCIALGLFVSIVLSPALDTVVGLARRTRMTRRAGQWLHDAAAVLKTALHMPRRLVKSIILSVTTQICDNVLFVLMIMMTKTSADWREGFVVFPVVVLAGLLPISLNGLGVVEYSTVKLLTITGLPLATAMVVALLLRGYLVGIAVIGFLLYCVEECFFASSRHAA